MSDSQIDIKKLRVANWRGVDVSIPTHCWTAITGPSGSGKTSLLFGGLEAWSARQFELLANPAAMVNSKSNLSIADGICGLSPVLASAGEIPRSRGQAILIDVLNLSPLLNSWWQQHGRHQCADCG
ncbi:MAG: excinuclease UvrABC ATPase subunit, partial [Myxococcota bacterium]